MAVYLVEVDGKRKIIITGMDWKSLKEQYKKEGKKIQLIDVVPSPSHLDD